MANQEQMDHRYRQILARLREAREQSGLSQTEAAALLDKPQWYVSRCETGTRKVDVVELLNFAAIYHKDLMFFIYDIYNQ